MENTSPPSKLPQKVSGQKAKYLHCKKKGKRQISTKIIKQRKDKKDKEEGKLTSWERGKGEEGKKR